MSGRSWHGVFGVALLLVGVVACGRGSSVNPPPPAAPALSAERGPGSVTPPPMPTDRALPASAMTTGAADHRLQMTSQAHDAASAATRATQAVSFNWSYIPAAATQVAYAPDGSLWALSTGPAGPNKTIWHYVNGTWTNLPGYASQIALAPDGSIWAITSFGGLYHYVNGNWLALGGFSKEIAVDASGNVYVVAFGNVPDNQIWKNSNGNWQQVGGYGAHVSAYPDNSLYVLTSGGQVWDSPSFSGNYNFCPGYVAQLAPLANGAGFYALGYTANLAAGALLYQYTPASAGDCRSGTYQATNGYGVNVAASGSKLAMIGTDGAIYTTTASAAATPPATSGSGTPLTGPALGPSSGWSPTGVANTFSYPVQSGFDGSGQTIAILIDSAASSSDSQFYLSYMQTPGTNRSISYVSVAGASLTPGANDAFESTLDVETVAGLAPGANVLVYVMPQINSQYYTDAINDIASGQRAHVVSMSFGGCEGSYVSGVDRVMAAAARSGVAMVASSGDQGSTCYVGTDANNNDLYRFGVGFPASDPNVIAVGGTETPQRTSLTSTTAWNDYWFTGNKQGSTGGGVSTSFAAQSYQNGFAQSSSGRNVPDIAMPAIGTAIYYQGKWTLAGGTSWSAPLFAAMLAEVYQYCGTSFNNAVQIPYYVARTAPSAFLDVVSGNNSYSLASGPSSPYYAGSGYDLTTGVGVPYGMPMAKTLCPNRTPAVSFAENRSPASVGRLPAVARRVDATPHLHGLVTLGRRDPAASTRIQLVLVESTTPADDERAVTAVLEAAGLTIERTFANHLVVDARGPASAVAALFATQLDNVAQGRETRYVPATTVTIPASLAPYVAGVTLDDVTIAVPHHRPH